MVAHSPKGGFPWGPRHIFLNNRYKATCLELASKNFDFVTLFSPSLSLHSNVDIQLNG